MAGLTWVNAVIIDVGGTGAGVDPSVLLQYGAVGFLAMAGIVTSATLYKRVVIAFERERERADRLEAELRQLNQTTQELMTRALQDATSAVSEALEAVAHRRGQGR